MTQPERNVLAETARACHERGDHLGAFDAARRGLEDDSTNLELQHRLVLALVNSGALRRAESLFASFGLANRTELELAALRARLEKEAAFASGPEGRRELLVCAASSYAAVAQRENDAFPAINAATLYLLAGDNDLARTWARSALDWARTRTTDQYWSLATQLEAFVVLNALEEARALTPQVLRLGAARPGDVASTRRQLARLGALDLLPAPRVLHVLADSTAVTHDSTQVQRNVDALLVKHQVGAVFSGLLSVGEIIAAESALAAGLALHVLLPFAREDCRGLLIEFGLAPWLDRFEDVLARATEISFATSDPFLGDLGLLDYSKQISMGLALLRAEHLVTDAVQLVIGPHGPALVPHAETWRVTTRAQVHLDDETWSRHEYAPTPPLRQRTGRVLLFADVQGFSKLNDRQLPIFVEQLLGTIGASLKRYRAHLREVNTWGDGVFAVFDDAAAAAAAAIDAQDHFARLDLRSLGLPESMALRVGGHAGPVFTLVDPVLDKQSHFGSHISRAARIEPITPTGSVYVTENFAALLSLDPERQVRADYVGVVPTAKSYGELRLFVLRPS